MTHPSVLGRFGLTGEASAGGELGSYPVTQQWAWSLHDAGFDGIFYVARHDPQLAARSVALFGISGAPDVPEVEQGNTQPTVFVQPIPADVTRELTDQFGIQFTGDSLPI